MKSEDLSYAAGLIDGEGCIGIYRNSHNGNYQLRICVEMVEEAGLAALHDLFGGRFYYKNHGPPKRPIHIWMVFNSAAEAALRALLPFLRVKKQQADVALLANWSWQTKASGKFFGALSADEQAVRRACHEKMKALNKRGVYGDQGKQPKGPAGNQEGPTFNDSGGSSDGGRAGYAGGVS